MKREVTKQEVYDLFKKHGLVCTTPSPYRDYLELYINGAKFKTTTIVWVTSDGDYSDITTDLSSNKYYWKFRGLEDLEKGLVFLIHMDVVL